MGRRGTKGNNEQIKAALMSGRKGARNKALRTNQGRRALAELDAARRRK